VTVLVLVRVTGPTAELLLLLLLLGQGRVVV